MPNFNQFPRQRSDRSDFRKGNQSSENNEMYEVQRQVLEKGQEKDRSKTRGRRGPGRSNYNSARIETHRQTQSLITEGDLAEDLKKKRFPGVKNESVMDRLEAVVQHR
ncbi:unnamed protein product [Psylliodes chrysocephalus]|uniref:Uncharacterized protein n=1 Tax=Psylliodes chrysocephalus TaxID=3402493 RepID=A0A9P0GB66_9CUCU|nr:unnamed protein product [Psylliodes chrysocephala]